MDHSVLVNSGLEVELGRQVLTALDHAAKINVALWVNSADYDDWRLVFSARAWDRLTLRERSSRFFQAVSMAGLAPQVLPPVMIPKTTDPFVRELRRIIGTTRTVEGMRLGGQTVGDWFLNDAYVYRIR